jgi:hypothetical protein
VKARQACTNFTGAEGAGAGRCPQVGLQCVHGGHFEQGAMRRGLNVGRCQHVHCFPNFLGKQ